MQVKALSFLLLATSSAVLAVPHSNGHGGFDKHGGNTNNAVQGNNGNNGGNNGGNAGNAGGNNGANNGGNNGGNTELSQANLPLPDTPPNADGESVEQAAFNWATDTNTVSDFLTRGGGLSGQELTAAAKKAFDAEVNELTHKAVLDKAFGLTDPAISKADSTLVAAGTFQFVVDQLNALAVNGSSLTPEEVTQSILAINNDRCPLVLPSIDAYVGKGSNGALKAVRPKNCPFDTATNNLGNVAGAPLDSGNNGGNGNDNANGHN